MPDTGTTFAIRLLRRDGWTCYRIATYLGVPLSEVRQALDPRASALHELWQR